jgi:ribosomal protein S18 acetylase RimI-like enzyme
LDAKDIISFMRISADSPLLAPDLIKKALQLWQENPHLDLLTNVFPRSFPAGQSLEIIKREALMRANILALPEEREHITKPFYRLADQFSLSNMANEISCPISSLALDYPEDWPKLYGLAMGSLLHWPDIVAKLAKAPAPLTLIPDPWLSRLLARPAFSAKGEGALPTSLPADIDFCQTRRDGTAISPAAKALPDGWCHVEDLITFSLPAAKNITPNARLTVTSAEPFHQSEITNIAATSFRHSRFHQDPKIGTALGDLIKKEWVGNFFRGQRGDALWIAKDADKVVGFCLLFIKVSHIVIDLIAAHADYRGKGVGGALLAAIRRAYPDKEIVAGTALESKAVGFYRHYGFGEQKRQMTYHYHREDR